MNYQQPQVQQPVYQLQQQIQQPILQQPAYQQPQFVQVGGQLYQAVPQFQPVQQVMFQAPQDQILLPLIK